MTEFRTVAQVGEKRISMESNTFPSLGAGPQRPLTFWDPYLRRNRLTRIQEIWYSDTRGGVACYYGVSHVPSQGGGVPSSTTFWAVLHARSQYEKQQPNSAR